jgi:hypothetical protein
MALLATLSGGTAIISMNRGDIGMLTGVVSGRLNTISLPTLGGSCTYPSENNVRDGVVFGTIYTGNLELPLETDVLTGIQYGASGTEFTGEAVAGGGETSHVF